MGRLTVALACVALSLSPGCGGDDEDTSPVESTPLPTVPERTTETQTETSPAVAPEPAPEPAPPPVEEPSGGATAPLPAPDSPENDVPPPPGSPADRFEQFCAEEPGACD